MATPEKIWPLKYNNVDVPNQEAGRSQQLVGCDGTLSLPHRYIFNGFLSFSTASAEAWLCTTMLPKRMKGRESDDSELG